MKTVKIRDKEAENIIFADEFSPVNIYAFVGKHTGELYTLNRDIEGKCFFQTILGFNIYGKPGYMLKTMSYAVYGQDVKEFNNTPEFLRWALEQLEEKE